MNARRWRGWLVAGAIFILGVAAGVAGTAAIGVRLLRQSLQAPAAARGVADRAAERMSEDLTKTLALTPDEAARVQAILVESAATLKAVRARAAADAAAELRAATARLAEALPAEKHAALYRVIGERYERLGLPPPAKP